MRPDCIAQVIKAVGRALTKPELNDIEQRLSRHMRALAQDDPQAWSAKSNAERLHEAAASAAQELVHEANVKQHRVALTILAHERIQQHLSDQAAKGIDGLDALDRVIAFHADGKSNFLSMESQSRAVRNDSLRQMLGTLTASNPKWFGLFENQEGVRAIVKEIFGEDSGVSEAKQGAKEWKATTDALRGRFNRAGGDVGKLDDWGMPHHHSQHKVAKVGREAWVNDIMPMINRDHYFNPDGSRMDTAQLTDFLKSAWTTIATGGANKLEPGQFNGNGARANRGNASREIHFKDAQSYMDYQAKYGEKSLYEVLVGHIESVSKDVALTETMGPNPDNTYRFFRDKSVINGKLADPTKVGKLDERAVKTDNLYNEISGKTQPVGSRWLAQSFDTLRNWLVASRLGSAIITSFSDEGTLYLTAHMNHLPEMKLLANELKALNPANRVEERMAQRAGLSMNTLLSSLNRFGQNGLGAAFSRKLANTVIRVSGLNAITEARKRAFGVTMMSGIGGVVKDHPTLKALDPADHRMLLSKGITEKDFQVWKKAQLEDWGGGNDTMLTPESIYRIPDAELEKAFPEMLSTASAPKKGLIRYYHGGEPTGVQGPLWFTSHLPDAEGWAARSPSMKVWYVDVPENHPARGGDPQFHVLPPTRIELPEDIASKRQPLSGIDQNAAAQLREQAATKLLAHVLEETDVAVIEPGALERSRTSFGLQRGTWRGELTRSFFLFKSFPLAMITRHFTRGMSLPNRGGRAAYLATLIAATTVGGIASLQIGEVLAGRDPRNLNPAAKGGIRNWIAALLKGGSLGIYGDFLFSDSTQHGNSPIATLTGPVLGTAEDMFNLSQGNIMQALQDKKTNIGAEATKFVRSNTPGASLWYTKAAMDHLIFHQLQEYFSPGYLAKMRTRAERDFGQSYWWEPGQVTPDRAPNVAAIAGE